MEDITSAGRVLDSFGENVDKIKFYENIFFFRNEYIIE